MASHPETVSPRGHLLSYFSSNVHFCLIRASIFADQCKLAITTRLHYYPEATFEVHIEL